MGHFCSAKSLRKLLYSEMEHSSILRIEIENLRRREAEQEERHTEKVQALARENKVLKVQLKKYVCAVQMLKKTEQNDSKYRLTLFNCVMAKFVKIRINYHVPSAPELQFTIIIFR